MVSDSPLPESQYLSIYAHAKNHSAVEAESVVSALRC